LRPIGVRDYETLRLAELDQGLVHSWRLGGQHPSPEAYAASLWTGVYAQFLVVEVRTGRVIGLACAYGGDWFNGTLYLAGARFVRTLDTTLAYFEGFALFIDYCLRTAPVRKLYLEVPSYNMSSLASITRDLAVEEGILRAHRFYDGDHWDVHVLAIYPDAWNSLRGRLL
jgi:hypothetical protein